MKNPLCFKVELTSSTILIEVVSFEPQDFLAITVSNVEYSMTFHW